eukprot:scaffold250880_cov30-Tisochrysis_lutea.AAC.2
MDWPRRARTSDPGEPVGQRVGQQGSVLLGSHSRYARSQEGGWFLPHGRGGVERGGGGLAPPPRGKPSINLGDYLNTRMIKVQEQGAHGNAY